MPLFTKKAITPPKRICLCLKEAREQKGLSLDALSHKIRVDKKFIIALEACEFASLPFSSTYQKHLIKAYLEALDIDPTPILNQFAQEELARRSTPTATPPVSLPLTHNFPLMIRFGTIALLVLGCFGYLGLQVQRILEPPKLVILTPEQGRITDQSSLKVAGETDPEVQVSINGTGIMQNQQGEFSETLDLPVGVNTITITAKKKHGKTTTEVRNVIVRHADSQFSLSKDSSILSGRL